MAFITYLQQNQTKFAVIVYILLWSDLSAPPFLKSTNIPGNLDMITAAIGWQYRNQPIREVLSSSKEVTRG